MILVHGMATENYLNADVMSKVSFLRTKVDTGEGLKTGIFLGYPL